MARIAAEKEAKLARALELYQSGVPVGEIAEALGYRGRCSVYDLFRDNGVVPNRESARIGGVAVKKEVALGLYLGGETSVVRLARDCGLSVRCVSDFLCESGVRSRNRRYGTEREDFFEVIDSEEKAYFLGWMVADGCVRVTMHNGRLVSLKILRTDGWVIERFRSALGTERPIRYEKAQGNRREQAVLRVWSKKMFEDLSQYGVVPRKSDKSFYPDLPDEVAIQSAFVRGLFDGDGCAYCFRSRVSWEMLGTQDLVAGVAEVLTKYAGVVARVPCKIKDEKFLCKIAYSSKADTRKIYNFLYGNADQEEQLWLERKREKLGFCWG